MRTVLVVGVGAGSPDHLTLQAVAAIGRADVFLLLDKGTAAPLVRLREQIIATHGRPDAATVVVEDPPRDRAPTDYAGEVASWHAARAEAISAVLQGLPASSTAAFLVWGDPSLYDSTLRVLDLVALDLAVEVVPGITAVQALTAAHRTTLNRVGEPVTITTGRQLRDAVPDEDVVVMLDGGSAWDAAPDAEVVWGANLGTPDEALVRGIVSEVAGTIAATKAAVKERAGWVMDVYLLRRPSGR